MRNKKLLILLSVFIICYLASQTALYVLSQIESLSTWGPGHRSFPVLRDDVDETQEKKNFIPSVLWNLRDYTDLSHQYGIPIILLDPVVLKGVVEGSHTENKQCLLFCKDENITSTGVMSHLWGHDADFLKEMEDKGFSTTYFTDESSETSEYFSPSPPSTIYTNYLFCRGKHTIHLTILYVTPAGYLWHGGMDKIEMHGDPLNVNWRDGIRLAFGTVAGAVENMEVTKTTVDGIQIRAPRYPSRFLHDLQSSKFLQCNHTRAKLFHALYGKHEDETAVIEFREATRHVLTQAKSALDNLGIRFWLSSGTCLGWYRQCDSIHYSGDVDIGIWIKDYRKNLIPAMLQNELSIKHIFGKESDSFTMSFENGEVKLDIFFFYEESDHMWNGATRVRTRQKYKYIFPKFTLCWTEFLGLKLHVPCETEQYLEANYGKDWFKPVKTWSWSDSPPNARPNGVWPEEEWDTVIQMFE